MCGCVECVALCRWLCKRAAQNDDGTYTRPGNNPSLLWADGTTITKKQAREECGFVVKVLYESPLYLNANRVEAGLQRHYKEGLGYEFGQVLWRVSGAGYTYKGIRKW